MLSKVAIFIISVQADWVTFVVTVGTAGAAVSSFLQIHQRSDCIYLHWNPTHWFCFNSEVSQHELLRRNWLHAAKGREEFFRHDSRGTASGVCCLAEKLEPVFPAAFQSNSPLRLLLVVPSVPCKISRWWKRQKKVLFCRNTFLILLVPPSQ